MDWDRKAFIYTSVIFTLVLILFLFLGFTTPLPLPAEQGILISFGDSEIGSGPREPRANERVQQEAAPPSQPEVTEVVEEQLTQDFEEAPSVASTNQETAKPVTESTPVTETVEEPVKVEEPTVNPNAMYRGRSTTSESTSSEGDDLSGTGNKGVETGDPESTNHSLGTGMGDGIGYDLKGRSHVALPKPTFDLQKEGTVVVRIRVDRSGKVTFAEPGIKGSTTLDKDLLAAAEKAALAARFNTKEDAALIQEGTITYVFRLKR